jgi:hypothetical protein
MTSQINYSSVNANYPVAGQDNDSQGFRDNFGAIKVALSTASNEITELQQTTAKLNQDNDFQGYAITSATLVNSSVRIYQNPTVDSTMGTVVLYANNAGYHDLVISTNTNFTVDGWPAESYASIRVAITPTTSTRVSINFYPLVLGGTVHKESSQLLPWTSTHIASSIWDIWTTNSGQDMFVKFVGTWT